MTILNKYGLTLMILVSSLLFTTESVGKWVVGLIFILGFWLFIQRK